jgi:hypothetical protein
MIHLPFDIFHLIFTFISFCKKNWLNIKLSSKLFKKIANITFIPIHIHFQKAVKDKNIFSLKNILTYKNIDLSYCNNDAIKIANISGNVEIVKLLFQNHRIDPSDQNNEAIQSIYLYGNTEIVKLLLQNHRVNPFVNNNNAIYKVCYREYIEIVKLLLQNHRIDPFTLYMNHYKSFVLL